jgi:hypothetical protein
MLQRSLKLLLSGDRSPEVWNHQSRHKSFLAAQVHRKQVAKTRLAPHQFHRRALISHIWLWVRRYPSNFTSARNLEWMRIREFAVLWHSRYHPFLLTKVLELSYLKLTTSSQTLPKSGLFHYDRLYPDFTSAREQTARNWAMGGCAPTFVWKRTLQLVEDSNRINEWHRYVIYRGRLFPVVLWRKFSLYISLLVPV